MELKRKQEEEERKKREEEERRLQVGYKFLSTSSVSSSVISALFA